MKRLLVPLLAVGLLAADPPSTPAEGADPAQCGDNVDNDGDGDTDCSDSGCIGKGVCDVSNIGGLIGRKGTQLGSGAPAPLAGDVRMSRGGVTVGDPILLGAIDKSGVDAVIEADLDGIRACWADQLAVKPGLAGKIVVKFVIAKDGTVSSATTKSSTMGDATVEECLNKRFMPLKFAEPGGNGVVIASYNFTFTPPTP